jgi:uncharacterized membrane protein
MRTLASARILRSANDFLVLEFSLALSILFQQLLGKKIGFFISQQFDSPPQKSGLSHVFLLPTKKRL